MINIKIFSAIIALAFFCSMSISANAQSESSTTEGKPFLERLQLTVQGGAVFESSEVNSQGSKLNLNAYEVYSFDDNFKAGLGYSFSRMRYNKVSSVYATGIVQASSKIFIPYVRISAGVDIKHNSNYQPGLMAGISAGMNYVTSKNLALNFEFGLKSFNFNYPPNSFTLFNEYGQAVGSGVNYKGSNNSSTMFDASLGISYSFRK